MNTVSARPLALTGAMLVVLLTLLLTGSLARGAELDINWQDGTLSVTGAASSNAHASILRDVAASLFPNARMQWQLGSTQVTPPAWSLVTEQTLRTLALTRSGHATVTNSEVRLRGVHDNPPGWQAALLALERTLLPGMHITNEVIVFDDSLSFAELCQRRFEATLRNRRVQFQPSSDELSPAARPLLDALIEIAADCPETSMLITGHSDANGREQEDVALGARRAEAVVSYMTAHGISAARLRALGTGSASQAEPADTPAARARNRRVEFSLLFE